MRRINRAAERWLLGALVVMLFSGCASLQEYLPDESAEVASASSEAVGGSVDDEDYDYLIGPGDVVQIFVWRNPEVSLAEVVVRPDGKITTPLVEDLVASGKTPHQLARDIEDRLETYIRQPIVTVILDEIRGTLTQQVRVIGQATTPQSLPYRRGLSLLDVMISVGGLTEFAAGNRAAIIRTIDGQQQRIPVRIEDLLEGGDIRANVQMRPGDVLVVPESWL